MKTVIEMAREANFFMPQGESFYQAWPEEIERFAELVRADAIADEREACAKLCDSHGPTLANGAMLAEAIRNRSNT
jgi:hypothetical protein